MNNILEWCEHERYMYNQKLTSFLGPELFQECDSFIEEIKEAKHLKVLECQKSNFERLWQRKTKNSHQKQDHSANYNKNHLNLSHNST